MKTTLSGYFTLCKFIFLKLQRFEFFCENDHFRRKIFIFHKKYHENLFIGVIKCA